MTTHIGLMVFPDITQLDMTGPYEVFTKFPDTQVHLLWKTTEAVSAAGGMQIVPTTRFSDCPQLEVLCIPGGSGMNALLEDEQTLRFVREQARGARYVTSVCTGSLVLGAAGLLEGRRATTHWMSHEMLTEFGAIAVRQRVVLDGNIITGGGVTAGIDFALRLAAEMLGETAAKAIQLGIEYDPAPPFDCGSPSPANAAVVAQVRAAAEERQRERSEAVRRAAARLTRSEK